MGNFVRAKSGGAWPKLALKLAAVICGCVLIRAAAERMDSDGAWPVLPEGLGRAALALELPGGEMAAPDIGLLALKAELPAGDTLTDPSGEPGEPTEPPLEDAALPTTREPDTQDGNDTSPPPETGAEEPPKEEIPQDTPTAPERNAVGTTITGKGSGYTAAGEGIYIKNKTGYDIDVEGALSKPLDFSAAQGAAVLIIHTHGSEAYNPSGEDVYVPSDPSRTEDKSFNVVRVGDELAGVLTERGITVYHNRELYDYPSYAGSYDRSLEAIKAELEAHPEIRVVIDLHRDALEGEDGTVYKTVADVGDEPCAQVMLICGSNYSGLKHPDWEKNLTFALKLQRRMVDDYPTLARPLKISEYRYNQHATTGSLIAEIGTNGNTLREALTAVRYFGQCLADVLTEG